jgi:hypothetical protein
MIPVDLRPRQRINRYLTLFRLPWHHISFVLSAYDFVKKNGYIIIFKIT